MTLLKEKVLRFCSKGRNKSIMWVRASPGFDSTLWSIFFFSNTVLENLSREGEEQLLTGNQLCIGVCFGLIWLNESQ